MEELDLKPLFDGADDWRLLWVLDRKVRCPRNDAQRTFHIVCEATELVNSDGFEKLMEQDTSLEDYAESFVQIGMPQVKPIFDRVIALLPVELRSRDQETSLFEYIRGRFDELNKLMMEFLQASEDVVAMICRYVRDHRDDFAEYANG